jgi:hypothetical protein
MGAITQAQLDAIAQHNTGNLVELYRLSVPWPVAMAMAEHEDPKFDPTIYNYYVVDPETGHKTDRLGIAYADQGAPMVALWRNPGDAGCSHDPHACGQYQVLDSLRLKQGGYGGVKLPYLNDLFDIEKNVHAALAGRDHDCGHIIAAGVTDAHLLALFLYFAHAEGLGKLIGGQYEGAFPRLKRLGKAITWANFCALPWGELGWWSLGNRLSGVAAAMERVPLWSAVEPHVKSGSPAEALPTLDPDVRPRCDALIVEVQNAEMARDLVLASRLREELDRYAQAQPSGEDVA